MPTDLVGEQMETQRFFDAVNVILSLQSSNGGFPAWEPQRAYRWLEVRKYSNVGFFLLPCHNLHLMLSVCAAEIQPN